MKNITPKRIDVIKNYAPISDEGEYARKWNIIKDDFIYSLYIEEDTKKFYLVISDFKGNHEKILLDIE